MSRTSEGVEFKKNAGGGAARAVKGRVSAQTRGKYGFDFSVAIDTLDGHRVLYMLRDDAYDLADALDVVLAETESKDETP